MVPNAAKPSGGEGQRRGEAPVGTIRDEARNAASSIQLAAPDFTR